MRKLIAGLCALGVVFAVFAVVASPAGAWLHNTNTSYVYRAPGPPPGSGATHCRVETVLWSTNPAVEYSEIEALSGNCVAVCGQVVMYYNGTLYNGPYVCERTDDGNGTNVSLSFGQQNWIPPGASIFGANFQAYSTTILDQWQVSILG